MPAPRVHQVLATLGYGDAIGHEVLGIQRVLRGPGTSPRSSSRPPIPGSRTSRPTTATGRASHPDNILIHHFSIGSRASRMAYALPDRMVLVYHNITPPEYFIGVHNLLVQLCFLGRRELRPTPTAATLALGDSEYNRQELEALGFPRTGVLPVVPDFSHLDVPPDAGSPRGVRRRVDERAVRGPDDPEQADRGRHPFVPRLQDAWFNPRSRLLLVGSYGGFEKYLAMLQQLIARLGATDVHFLGHVSNEELTAYYDVADVFLCASEHEGFCVPLIEAFHKGVPVWPTPRRPCPPRWTAAACCTTTRTRRTSRA
jgi:L-malate glycosyltransferase